MQPAAAESIQRDPLVYHKDRAELAREGLRGEWVLTNGLGGFAMGTWANTPTRRYHGVLIAAERPPVERALLLSGFGEDLVLTSGGASARVHLLGMHFADHADRLDVHPLLTDFETGPGYARWSFRGEIESGGRVIPWRATKALTMVHGRNAADVDYVVEADGADRVRLELRPLLGLRDFHKLNDREVEAERPTIGVRTLPGADGGAAAGGVVAVSGGHGVHLHARAARFTEAPEWWRGVEYVREWERGQDCVEDLFSPGVFVAEGAGRIEAGVFASMDAEPPADAGAERARWAERAADLGDRACAGLETVAPDDERSLRRLGAASDAYVVARQGVDVLGDRGVSVIAGYPWFSDWGRDTMICLPGLFLELGRLDEAFGVLATFGAHVRDGVIPNRFDDYGGEPHYNTVDASLWYLHAACAWAEASGREAEFRQTLLPACLEIVRYYRNGTMHGIGADPNDGLVTAGDEDTQLTWMDAQRDGVTFTPRHGKAVEINALWIHGLRVLARRIGSSDGDRAQELRRWADQASASFAELFWNESRGCWYDTLRPTGSGRGRRWKPVDEARPNQVFAMSLEHGPIHGERGEAQAAALERARRAMALVERELLTDKGLRTLSPKDADYRGAFWGPLFERDAAYHQGTVWPWLTGAYAEAVLRLGGPEAPAKARAALAGIEAELEGWTPGAIAEVFDGDDAPAGGRGRPRWPAGCIAQAWSVAETLRAWRLVARAR